MLFPDYDHQPVMHINLDEEARRYPGADPNPLLDPATCSRMIAEAHRRHGVAWSYGGYLENRRNLWRGSYLERTGSFVHLGVDFNVPQGTAIASGYGATVLLVDDDGDQDGGWGARVILSPEVPGYDVYLVYAHLQAVRVKPGDVLNAGDRIAEVGGPPHNGNWYPHLHVQAVHAEYFDQVMVEQFLHLDGYGHPDQLEQLKQRFPDPLPCTGLLTWTDRPLNLRNKP